MSEKYLHQARISQTIGDIVRVLLRTARRDKSIGMLQEFLVGAVHLGQVEIWRDRWDEPTGFVVWAFLDDEVSSQLRESGLKPLHQSEWNAGLNLWIIDFCALPGQAMPFFIWLKSNTFKSYGRASWFRIRSGASYKLPVTYKRKVKIKSHTPND